MAEHPFESDQGAEGGSLQLREYWNVLAKRLWTVVLVFVLIVTGVGLYTFQQPKVYEASAKVIIELEQPKVLGSELDDGVNQPTGWYSQSQYFETQLRVIESRHVAERVVRDQGLAENLDFLGLTHIDNDAELSVALEASDPAARFLSMLSVEPVPDTNMVLLKVQHETPAMAAELANAVAEAYREQNIEYRLEAMQDAFHWLETQYKSYESKLQSSSESLGRFKEENPLLFTNPEEQQALTNHRLESLNQKLIDVEFERRRAGHLLAELKGLKVEHVSSSGMSLLAEAPNLTHLTNRYLELKQKEQELLPTFLESSLQVRSLREQLALVEKAIEAEVKSVRQAYQSQYDTARRTEDDLRVQIGAVTDEAQKLDHLKLLYEQVESQRAEQQRLFELVQRRLNEVSLTKLLENNNIRILDYATVPTAPVRPRVLFNMLIAAVLGLLGGVGLAFLVEMMDTTVKSQEDVELQLNMPFLGIIPQVREADRRSAKKLPKDVLYRPDLHVGFFPKSSVAECARTIRTNIMFMSPGTESKVLLVTSPSPLEGKTTTAINLAIVMAQSNSRVLLIEADMRRPRLHKAFGVQPTEGLSTVLAGQHDVFDVVLSTGFERLDLLPCGALPPNPSELFHTPTFAATLKKLAERYDRVIIDSPPVIAVTDAMIIAQHSDGVIIVTRAGSTRKELLRRTRQLLEGINAPVLGAILNNVDLENRRHGRYYYYYRRYGRYYDEGADPP